MFRRTSPPHTDSPGKGMMTLLAAALIAITIAGVFAVAATANGSSGNKTGNTADGEKPSSDKSARRLARLHSDIVSDYPSVRHLEGKRFAGMDRDRVVVFDVREAGEFAVSHLEGAILLSPETTPEEFAARFGDKIQGKEVVFYCSVGRRSSIMAERLANVTKGYNLVGGIFQWHNEDRPAFMSTPTGEAQTPYVHPYNAFWARYVSNRKAARYTPEMPQDASLPR